MQTRAEAKWVRMSPRKVRRVVNEIRGKSAGEAMALLRFMPYRAARAVESVLRSAMYNLVNHERMSVSESEAAELKVVEAAANPGPTTRRWQPRARGRAFPILKRQSHISIVLSSLEE